MRTVDPRSLTRDEAEAALATACQQDDAARLAAGLMRGNARRQLKAYARAHGQNAIALADALHGPPGADIQGMSDAELAAELMR